MGKLYVKTVDSIFGFYIVGRGGPRPEFPMLNVLVFYMFKGLR
jgi:hypothetical protein